MCELKKGPREYGGLELGIMKYQRISQRASFSFTSKYMMTLDMYLGKILYSFL